MKALKIVATVALTAAFGVAGTAVANADNRDMISKESPTTVASKIISLNTPVNEMLGEPKPATIIAKQLPRVEGDTNFGIFSVTAVNGSRLASPTNTGTSMLAVLNGPSDQAKYSLRLPATWTAFIGTDGSVQATSTTGVTTTLVEVPWALSRTGENVKTSFSLDGTTLTQKVDAKASDFPVVADPQLVCNWGICDLKFNKQETKDAASGGWAYLGAACILGGPAMVAACGASIAWYLSTAQDANNSGRCFAIHNIPPYPYAYNDGDCR